MTSNGVHELVDFHDAVVVVTGAGGGFGRAICKVLGSAGALIAALDADEAHAQETVRAAIEAGAAENSLSVAVDVRDHQMVDTVFRDVAATAGHISTMVACAGVREISPVLDIEAADWENVIAINLSGVFYCCQAAARIMVKAEASPFPKSIVNVASVAGLIAITHRPAYTASKHGVVGLTKNLAKDLAPHGIRVNAIAPGTIRTPLTQAYYQDPEFIRGLEALVPLGSGGTADDVAYTALYLASPLASFVTGAVVTVDGGWAAEKGYSIPGAASPYLETKSTVPA